MRYAWILLLLGTWFFTSARQAMASRYWEPLIVKEVGERGDQLILPVGKREGLRPQEAATLVSEGTPHRKLADVALLKASATASAWQIKRWHTDFELRPETKVILVRHQFAAESQGALKKKTKRILVQDRRHTPALLQQKKNRDHIPLRDAKNLPVDVTAQTTQNFERRDPAPWVKDLFAEDQEDAGLARVDEMTDLADETQDQALVVPPADETLEVLAEQVDLQHRQLKQTSMLEHALAQANKGITVEVIYHNQQVEHDDQKIHSAADLVKEIKHEWQVAASFDFLDKSEPTDGNTNGRTVGLSVAYEYFWGKMSLVPQAYLGYGPYDVGSFSVRATEKHLGLGGRYYIAGDPAQIGKASYYLGFGTRVGKAKVKGQQIPEQESISYDVLVFPSVEIGLKTRYPMNRASGVMRFGWGLFAQLSYEVMEWQLSQATATTAATNMSESARFTNLRLVAGMSFYF